MHKIRHQSDTNNQELEGIIKVIYYSPQDINVDDHVASESTSTQTNTVNERTEMTKAAEQNPSSLSLRLRDMVSQTAKVQPLLIV